MSASDPTAPGRPRFDHRADGFGVGSPTPRLTWRASANATGYEIEISDLDGQIWTSAVAADANRGTPWVGVPLTARERRTVRVRALGAGAPSEWSEPASVEAALLDSSDWTAEFIEAPVRLGARPIFRHRFMVAPGFSSARMYVTYHGIGVARLNGMVIGDEVLAPGWQNYPTRLTVSVHDLTGILQEGENLLEFEVGDGWWAGHLGFNGLTAVYGDSVGVIAQVETRRGVGVSVAAATDETWQWTAGPTVDADVYNGETHDSRVSVDALSPWLPARVVATDKRILRASAAPPVRRTQELGPQRVWQSPKGRTLIDFGQNLVGWVRLSAHGPAGSTVTLRHAEVLDDGEIGVRPLRAAKATDHWILSGDDGDTWEPSFTYHGFRFVEVTCTDGAEVDFTTIAALVVHSDLERTGWFDTDHPGLQRLHDNVVWSMRGNFVSIPTDCPQRDERLGWTGDIAVFASTASYLYDSTAFLMSWYEDLISEQGPDGLIPYFVPSVPFPEELQSNPIFKHTHTAVWGDASTLVPFALYEESGDIGILRRSFPTMRRWVDGVRALAGEGLVWDSGFQYGDWLDPSAPAEEPARGATDPALVATAYFANSARLAARAASLIGDDEEHKRLDSLHRDIRAAFRARFLLPDGRLSSHSQTAYAIVLQLDLLDGEDERHRAGAALIELVREAGHRIGTGFVGTPLILDALASVGAVDDAYRLLLQDELPSWLYAVTMGATTMWERWDSMLPDGSINPGGMTSFNHYAFGAVASWLHSSVAGLSSLAPGWTRMRVAPRPRAEITRASTTHKTPQGTAAVSWVLEGDTLVVEFDVPPATVAVLDIEGLPDQEFGPGRHVFRWPSLLRVASA